MNKLNDVFNKAYFSIVNEEAKNKKEKEVSSPDPEVEPDNGNPIDDLTKENIATIDEDSEDEFEEEFEDDGWGNDVEENLSYLLDTLENFTYEIRNCVRGTYTNCKTKEELKNYLTNDLVDLLTNAAEEI